MDDSRRPKKVLLIRRSLVRVQVGEPKNQKLTFTHKHARVLAGTKLGHSSERTPPWRPSKDEAPVASAQSFGGRERLAEQWAREIESKLHNGEAVIGTEARRTTLLDALDRYLREITPGKRGKRQETGRIQRLKKHPISKRTLAQITGTDVASYRDARLAGVAYERFVTDRASGLVPAHQDDDPRAVGPDTVRLELAIISNLYKIAMTEWGMPGLVNPVKQVRKPKAGKWRDRRLHGDEEERLLGEASPILKQAIILAIETAMRRSELAGLKRSDIDAHRRVVRLVETKNGDSRLVPLSPRALDAIRALPVRLDGYLFGWPATVKDDLTHDFGALCKALELPGLRFHDLRHEAISRLFERGWSIAEVAAVSGHKTWTQLRRYTQLRAENLALKMAA